MTIATQHAEPTAAHTPAPHELRNAWHTAKKLEEQLEVADQPVLRRIALYVREQVFRELMAVEGYQEVPDSRSAMPGVLESPVAIDA